ncbi:MAG: hypothetical protein OXH09_08150 [Gammaproteobacteria bacterium]|nr:hypothetical protein [Gammaproteobacteria bacterium]
MGLKHLQVAVWAVAFAAAGSASPLDDGDNDGVMDEMDICPDKAGDVNNFGCPTNEEIVLATGSRTSMSVRCPQNTFASHWSDCPSYSIGWGLFYVGWLGPHGVVLSSEVYADEDGDGVYDDPDQCPSQKGPSYFDGCPASVYCASEPNMYERDCYKWKIENLSVTELGAYFDGLRSFAEGGCGGDYYHWACYFHNSAAAINNSEWQDPVWLQGWADLLTPPNCPTYYYAQGTMPTVGMPVCPWCTLAFV